MRNAYKKGFTLVEISIVMVILALITGGVLVGRELITSSQIRATVKQIEMFNTAYAAFILKFGCIPGDCADADALGFTPKVVTLSDASQMAPSFNLYESINPISTAHAFVMNELQVNMLVMQNQGGSQENLDQLNDSIRNTYYGGGSSEDYRFRFDDVYDQLRGGLPGLQKDIVSYDQSLYNDYYAQHVAGGSGGSSAPAPQLLFLDVKGDGNGVIGGGNSGAKESVAAQLLLDEANFISGMNGLNGQVPIYMDASNPVTGNKATLLLVSLAPQPNALSQDYGFAMLISASAVGGGLAASGTPADFAAMDGKIDDQLPLSGMFRTSSDQAFPDPITKGFSFDPLAHVGSNKCIISDGTRYVYNLASDDAIYCVAQVKTAFTWGGGV